jgi:hypothetical protein
LTQREVDLERFQFLKLNFEELHQRHGGVVGNKLKRFAPRRVKFDKPVAKAPERLPANSALEPTQRTLF